MAQHCNHTRTKQKSFNSMHSLYIFSIQFISHAFNNYFSFTKVLTLKRF